MGVGGLIIERLIESERLDILDLVVAADRANDFQSLPLGKLTDNSTDSS